MSGATYTPAQVQEAYQRLLSPEDALARIVLADLGEVCHAGTSTQGTDPYDTAFRNGQRAVFLYIAGRVQAPLIGG